MPVAVAQPEGVSANPRPPQVCRKWSLAICSQIPSPLSTSPPHAWLAVAVVPHLTLFWCGSCAPSLTKAMAMMYPAMPLVLVPRKSCWPDWKYPQANFNLVGGVFFRSLGWVVGRAWMSVLGTCHVQGCAHTGVFTDTGTWGRHPGHGHRICSLHLSTKPDCGLRGDFSVPFLPSI